MALVTGGAGEIGGAIVAALEGSGHRVEVLDREVGITCDLGSERETRAASREMLERHGRCDVLVHAAAAFDGADLDSIELAGWRRVLAVNVEAGLWLCQELVPSMRQRGFGRIIFVVSDTVWQPPSLSMVSYVTSKAALVGLTRSLAASLGRDGITVNGVAPGLTSTASARQSIAEEQFELVRERQAVPRTLVPADTAAAVAFLASEEAAAFTGQTLTADGGLVMR